MFAPALTRLAEELLTQCRAAGLTLATAESCTGGLVAGLLTSIAGSSDVFDRGFVSYSNAAKVADLGVAEKLIAESGAVSEEAARAMAEGALRHAKADIAIAVTGIAGPGGGTAAKPVGLVHIAAARRGTGTLHRRLMLGEAGREGIRLASVEAALQLASEVVAGTP
ncbi:MAG: CinA family protein [Hyphomicrobiales bacterium]